VEATDNFTKGVVGERLGNELGAYMFSIALLMIGCAAVELFGENLPAFTHATVGSVESRFYYSDGAYNVKLRPIIFTYSPEIKSIVKNGSNYTLTVDYIDELPTWMEKTVAKTVEFGLIQNEDGTFCIKSMKILSVKASN